jgi:hypothetical protein
MIKFVSDLRGRWFFFRASSKNKTDRYDITEILLKVALITITLTIVLTLDLSSLVDSIFISMGTDCAPLLAYLFLPVYEADFLQGLLKNKDTKLTFNSSFRYIDDVLLLNNSRFDDYLHLIYQKDTTDNDRSASYLDLDLEIGNRRRLKKQDSTTNVLTSLFQ